MPNKRLTETVMPSGLTEQEQIDWKSLRLAELMRWETWGKDLSTFIVVGDGDDIYLMPYADTMEGKAQAFEILMAYPQVMALVTDWEDKLLGLYVNTKQNAYVEPTQTNMLDQVLIMMGVKL